MSTPPRAWRLAPLLLLACEASASPAAVSDIGVSEEGAAIFATCDRAMAHYAECTGETLEPSGCTEEAATAILERPCEGLEAFPKGDGGGFFGWLLGDDEEAPPRTGARIDRIVIHKATLTLIAYQGDEAIDGFGVAIGSADAWWIAPKVYEGDRHTPQGVYSVTANRDSVDGFHVFLALSYPNAEDRTRYAEALAAGDVPEGRGIGSAIGIHGGHDGVRRAYPYWTAGCVAVSDDAIEWLSDHITADVRVEIDLL